MVGFVFRRSGAAAILFTLSSRFVNDDTVNRACVGVGAKVPLWGNSAAAAGQFRFDSQRKFRSRGNFERESKFSGARSGCGSNCDEKKRKKEFNHFRFFFNGQFGDLCPGTPQE